MQESIADIERLRAVMTRSAAQAGPFLRSSFQIPEHSLTAEQMLAYFDRIRTVALATATGVGTPRVSPIGCLLMRDRFFVPTTTSSARCRMVLRRPEVSLTAFDGIELAVIVHGRAMVIPQDAERFAEIEAQQQQLGSESPRGWGTPGERRYLAIEPERILTYTATAGRIVPS